jgi:hypothetical protein
MRKLKKIILTILVLLPFIGKRFNQMLMVENRLHERLALKKLSNILFKVTFSDLHQKVFYLKDISLGGLSFFLDANDQEQLFRRGSLVTISMSFEGMSVENKYKVAWARSGQVGCQVVTNRNEYKKFVMEKMADILVRDDSITG